MKKSVYVIIVIFVALAGSAVIHYGAVNVSAAMAFMLGAVICAIALYIYTQNAATYSSNSTNDALPSSTVYVGNLPYKVNENDVKNLFSDHGEVFSVRLMKDKRTGKRRGFGFVVMAEADAPRAIKKLNNFEYLDRTLKVREANEPKMQDNE